jgi:hypothetical protein
MNLLIISTSDIIYAGSEADNRPEFTFAIMMAVYHVSA